MTAHFSPRPWRVTKSRRKGWFYEVRDVRGDVLAVTYDGPDDARLMAAAPRLLASLKHLEAIVRLHEGELRASARAKLEAARRLIDELEEE